MDDKSELFEGLKIKGKAQKMNFYNIFEPLSRLLLFSNSINEFTGNNYWLVSNKLWHFKTKRNINRCECYRKKDKWNYI